MDVSFRVLGPLEVHYGDSRLEIGTPKQRTVLAMLLLHANQAVTPARLVNELWPEHAPNSAHANVTTYLSRLRRVLAGAGCRLERSDSRYVLTTRAETIDLHRFAAEAAAGDAASAAADPAAAAERWGRAAAMWHGEIFEGVPTGPTLDIARTEWTERRTTVLEQYARAQLRLGNPAVVVADLRRHAGAEPLRESGWLLLMAALYLEGNPAAALRAYEDARSVLAEQLGVGPTAHLRRMRDAIGIDDRVRVLAQLDSDTDNGAAGAAGAPVVPRRKPAQLPADVSAFTGRTAQLHQLTSLLRRPQGRSTVVVSAISGTPGVGKTALAVHWAHQVAERFPDGQLYVNLRGYDPDEPMTAADALARFLAVLGVADSDIPVETDERAARYRTETAGRRMLIVLDNVLSEDHVRPLLPGTGSCAVVVTSRDRLAGLVARDGATRLDLDLLPEADAVALLRQLIGVRVDAEPEAAGALASLCARLPLALRVAAELAVSRATTSLAQLVAELGNRDHLLDRLDAGGDPHAAVAAVFSWSYRHLPADVARVFRLFGLHPGRDADAYAVAALADTDLDAARRALDLLARAHLVHPTGADRFGMHDLLWAYAKDEAATDDRRAALGRLFDYYLATAATAIDLLYPAEAHRRPRVPAVTTPVPDLGDPAAARRWLDAERACLRATAGYAATDGWPTFSIRLPALLFRYLAGGLHDDGLAIFRHGRHAARQVGDRAGEANAINGIGSAYAQVGRHAAAAEQFNRALRLFGEVGDRTGEARARTNLGLTDERLGRYASAADQHERALANFRHVGDRTGEARALTNLGIVEQRLGRHAAAGDHLRQAYDLFSLLGDRTGEASALDKLGTVDAELGRYEPAVDHHQRSLALYRQLGNRRGEAGVLDNLGIAHCLLGRLEEAAAFHLRALALFREIGDRDGEAWALNGLGAASEPAHAAHHYAAALTVAAETGVRDQQARAHAGLATAYRATGDLGRAREHEAYASALYTDLGRPALKALL
ncbi:AfsR/SARP family transcriptional regulator [Virgisporangium aurantiacum]|uniref:XRE family transcriptional regulator n=1 Tax=Virgisporangium aurantiacum TaxID=175570 RepID=A0A8J4E571_9ACTN|nr:BTAD domain-containing putative transcriptional regulator [Virgisporangium aurantiacum]GIJ61824.1 XRE family transcriptional regulator [Virgisporangium aurantiacum]